MIPFDENWNMFFFSRKIDMILDGGGKESVHVSRGLGVARVHG